MGDVVRPNDEDYSGAAGPVALPTVVDERPRGAIDVAKARVENQVLAKVKAAAARSGDDFYYRWPVKNKDGSTDWVEGPSIKAANVVARYYGNNATRVRTEDKGAHWLMTAQFYDMETGFVLERQFQQRKNQSISTKMDADRQQDIAFQIGQSKAIRNVICNALTEFTDFAFEEARKSIVERVGKDLPVYKAKIKVRLIELEVEINRVERRVGRKFEDWLAPDVAMIVAEIQACQDGMATAGEMWPLPETERPTIAQHDPKPTNGKTEEKKPEPKAETKKTEAPKTERKMPAPPEDTWDAYLNTMVTEFEREKVASDKAAIMRTFVDSIEGAVAANKMTPERSKQLLEAFNTRTTKPEEKKPEEKKPEPAAKPDKEADYQQFKADAYRQVTDATAVTQIDELQDQIVPDLHEADRVDFVNHCNTKARELMKPKAGKKGK